MTPERLTTTTIEPHVAYQDMTKTSNEYFDLVSTLYHSLKGAKTYACYAEDARTAGDQELASFFEQCQQQSFSTVEQAKPLLAPRSTQHTSMQPAS